MHSDVYQPDLYSFFSQFDISILVIRSKNIKIRHLPTAIVAISSSKIGWYSSSLILRARYWIE